MTQNATFLFFEIFFCLNSYHAKKKITNFNKFLPTEFLSTNAQNDNAFQQKKEIGDCQNS